MQRWKIRPAMPQDADALSKCVDAAYANYKSRIADLPAVSEGISEDIENHLVWVATLNRTVVGGVVMIQKSDLHRHLADVRLDGAKRKIRRLRRRRARQRIEQSGFADIRQAHDTGSEAHDCFRCWISRAASRV